MERRTRHDDPEDPIYYVVLHDPEGNEFCVSYVRRQAASSNSSGRLRRSLRPDTGIKTGTRCPRP